MIDLSLQLSLDRFRVAKIVRKITGSKQLNLFNFIILLLRNKAHRVSIINFGITGFPQLAMRDRLDIEFLQLNYTVQSGIIDKGCID